MYKKKNSELKSIVASIGDLMGLLERLWLLNRTLVSDDMDRAIEIIGEYIPRSANYKINQYPSGQKVWTWTVPERFHVTEAYLELLTPNGPKRIVDFADNPLHVVSYSPAIDQELGFEDLREHLHSNPEQPSGIPWVFRFYDKDWGFCLPHNLLATLPKDGRYKAVIKSEFTDGSLKVGECFLPGETDEEILIVCDVCHPSQVNDSLSGVVVAVDLLKRLAERSSPPRYGVRVLFLPETIGSIAWLANNEDHIKKCRFGIYGELFGHKGKIRFQRTRQDDHILDRVTRYVITKHTDGEFIEDPFCGTIITNDEKVTNAPGVDIPTIALNRWPYALYHTSLDTPAEMLPESLAEMSRVYEDIIEILELDFRPKRTFKGPLFLSGLDWGDFDWKATRERKRAVQDLAGNLEGDLTAFEIAQAVGLDFILVLEILGLMERQGLILRCSNNT